MGVDDVDLVPNWIDGQVGRVGADLQGPILPEVDQVEYGDGVGPAVADVGVLPIAVGYVREAAPTAARSAEEECTDNCSQGSRERESERRRHCSESIEGRGERQG